ILKKSQKYVGTRDRPIDLLVYITHWRFLSSEEAIRLVQHRLQSCTLSLGYVFLMEPRAADDVSLRLLSPPPEDSLEGATPVDLQGHWWLNLDPSKAFLVSER